MNKIVCKIRETLLTHPNLAFFLKYICLFTLLLLSVASMAFYKIIATESNPFFYANF
jgi:hypothetical protein